MKRIILITTVICAISLSALAQQAPKRKIEAVRTTVPIKIDGVLDEEIWSKVPITTDFIQRAPNPGAKASKKTEVKFIYNDNAIYVGALLYDSPDGIIKGLSKRDEFGNSDAFLVNLIPFNNGRDAYQFFVTAAGVQRDMKLTEGNNGIERNASWDAVWESKVNITDKGWIVEMKIPYSEIRFPNTDKQVWGINVWRYFFGRNEWSSFNFVDDKLNGMLTQSGELHGIENIKPPLRLSVTPYFSDSYEKNRETSDWKNKIGGGLDLKYGINESFTLDMMLIPDFAEVESDDQILNLTPFETKFEEKRQFFNEGTELFSKGGIFYSKRIGKRPAGHGAVRNSLNAGTYKEIKENPIESSLINATKLSGRTNKGLGIGFFNAMTNNTYAKVVDENNIKKKILTEPFTNYNMLVFDQTLKNNSYVSFMNTNVSKERDKYMANVTGTEFRLENKDNSYAINGSAIVSQKYNNEISDEYGQHLYWNAAKIKGNFLFSLSQLIETDDYDPNDMGYLQRNNKFDFNGNIKYNIYKPFGKFLSWYNTLDADHSYLYSSKKYIGTSIYFVSDITFKNYWLLSLNLNWNPKGWRDYFVTKVEGRMFRWTEWLSSTIELSTDNRKAFSISTKLNYGKNYGVYKNLSKVYSVELTPQLRVNDKLSMNHSLSYERYNSFHLVNNSDVNNIYFGLDDNPEITNTFTTNYIFNNKSSFSLRMRHYWSRANYEKFYKLQDDGYVKLVPDYTGNHDINYNAFNIDFVYNWRFAPGSEISVIWKTAINEGENFIRTNSFSKNFKNTLDLPSASSLSVKLFYYLDWKKFKKRG